MGELRIPLDPLNPAQFLACCGLFEAVNWDAPEALLRFEADPATPRRAAAVITGSGLPDLRGVLQAARDAAADFSEYEETVEKSVRPARLRMGTRELVLDWWLDEFYERTTNLKCWAGQVTTQKLFDELPPQISVETPPEELFSASTLTKSKFGMDPRSAWNALDFGFSPNEQGKDSKTYPIVEVLGAIGLQGFRLDARRREGIRYFLWSEPMPLLVARTAAVAAWDGLPRCRYEFDIAKRGQSYKYFTLARFAERKSYY
ncbi:MAG TPA: hypothetical protein DEH78_32135 [Solibacterales bacterium]|nr:hypothetical protein [Bryobacterales bacterium]